MTTLLVDAGNTRVKWARLEGARLGRQHAAPHAGWTASDYARRLLARPAGIERVLVASVAGERVARPLGAAVRRVLGIAPEFVASTARAGGVVVGYDEPWRLGVDRFVAMIGAHGIAPRRAALVVDVGTAMTIDLVDADGRHLGGAIVPGPQLMVDALLRGTKGIRSRAAGAAGRGGVFARDTRAAIEQGARYACAGAVERAFEAARERLGRRPVVLLTGGDAPRIATLLGCGHRSVPELVLRGLAVLAAGEGGR